MATILVQLFVALAVSLVLGFTLGATFGYLQRPTRPSPATIAGRDDLAEVVEREAQLIERLADADAARQARAAELADANEEITCLLEQLHEARTDDARRSAAP